MDIKDKKTPQIIKLTIYDSSGQIDIWIILIGLHARMLNEI